MVLVQRWKKRPVDQDSQETDGVLVNVYFTGGKKVSLQKLREKTVFLINSARSGKKKYNWRHIYNPT